MFLYRESILPTVKLSWCSESIVEHDAIALLQGDVIERLSVIPDSSINLIVTSPPYGIGKEYEQDTDLDDPAAYSAWCRLWINHCHRILTSNGTLILNVGTKPFPGRAKQVPIPYLLWDALSDFFLIQEIVWHYGAGGAGKRYFSQRNEKFLWLVKDQNDYIFNLDAIRDKNVKYPNQKKNGKLRCNPDGKNPSDVWKGLEDESLADNPTDFWEEKKVTSGKNRSSKERARHPAQFPEAIIERCIRGFSNEGDLVLDPFVGSGTTAVVCLRNGRRCVGIDLHRDYLENAVERLMRVTTLPLR
uniref:Type II methyltransferase n=1 Tax=uncultured marine group II/III euryarchaeote AD1000_88_C03 TaxID=1457820 RepID=A0A075FYL3_9EURY|nr:DNA methylase N-4/N-6 domain-containing protein (yhdJ) [uncultured marine group II/III euryarchaeote AD1000_88_C03]